MISTSPHIRIIALLFTLSAATTSGGCSFAQQVAGESVGLALDHKTVTAKAEPNELIAGDGSHCTVSRDKFEKTRVGEGVLCMWKDDARSAALS